MYHQTFKVESDKFKPVFHDVSDKVREIISESKIKNGIVLVYSQHTTCSVIIQEECHDITYDNTKFIHQDLLDVLDNLIPKCRRENQYIHPGPEHIKVAVNELKEKAEWSLNTDAHLRSCIIGRSVTIPVIDGKAELGEFGHIYFIDFDSVRIRIRTVYIQIIGE